jgi:hypothetical protein
MTVQTTPFDVGDHLKSDDMILAYLAAAFEDGDSALIRAALNDVVRARGIISVHWERRDCAFSLRYCKRQARDYFAYVHQKDPENAHARN